MQADDDASLDPVSAAEGDGPGSGGTGESRELAAQPASAAVAEPPRGGSRFASRRYRVQAVAVSIWSGGASRLGLLRWSFGRLAAQGEVAARDAVGRPVRWLAIARRSSRTWVLARTSGRREADPGGGRPGPDEPLGAGAEPIDPAPAEPHDGPPPPADPDTDPDVDGVGPGEPDAAEPTVADAPVADETLDDPLSPPEPVEPAERVPVRTGWHRRARGLVVGAVAAAGDVVGRPARRVAGLVARAGGAATGVVGRARRRRAADGSALPAEPADDSSDAEAVPADAVEPPEPAPDPGPAPDSDPAPDPDPVAAAGGGEPEDEAKDGEGERPSDQPPREGQLIPRLGGDHIPGPPRPRRPQGRLAFPPGPTAGRPVGPGAAAGPVRSGHEASRERGEHQRAMQKEDERRAQRRRRIARLLRKDRARRHRRRRMLLALFISPLLVASVLGAVAYYVDTIPAPADLALPESTTIYYADGTTPMATLGSENRTIIAFDDMNAPATQAIVAAEDRTFWSNSGVSLSSVVRAAWNNVTGGAIQGGSTITQQYVRTAAGLQGVTFARKTREALLAWKMDRSYSKEKILEFYLNTVAFGRGAYGIEAAAQAYFGKTTRRSAPPAQQVTVSEAMVLASVVKQPEPDPTDPVGHPGYDPARGGTAAANALLRWGYVRDGMVALGYLTNQAAAALQYPHTVRALDLSGPRTGLDRPTGLVVDHVLSELRLSPPFAGQAPDYIRNGGFHIVTTVDKRAQDVAEAAADIRRVTAPEVDRGQPANWQAALVAVEPGTGRVLAYYGGNAGTGADFAGWYYDANGEARGYGQHPPGSSFKVYDLAEALRQGIPLSSHWDSPAVKEFPNSGRTNSSPTGPVRNSSTAPCQPDCTLLQATVASLNIPFFDLTEHLGPANVLDMAAKAGIDSMWTDPAGQQAQPVRVDLPGSADKDLVASTRGVPAKQTFSTEVGIGQYGVTVLDHANGMATFAAGGERARAHFVHAVYRHDDLVYAEQLTQSSVGLTPAQVDELTSALSQVPSAKLPNGWEAAGKTGTWQAGNSLTDNAHVWMVGYTRALAVAVWLGTTDGKALKTKDGKSDVFGSTHAAPIWRQFMVDATAAMNLDPRQRSFAANVPASPGPVATGP